MEKKTVMFDMDGIICDYNVGKPYIKAKPLPENIALINTLYKRGHKIIIATARKRYSAAKGWNYKRIVRNQLLSWGVLHHELHFGKPQAHYYVDDRNASTDNLRNLLYMGEL